ncbi:MAG TPA: iron-containing alcohol dehydrogenase, partial [Gemmatales bacterium]|nr:iron-containing alcohol dehydrogenase [Gemmatales bacterium]
SHVCTKSTALSRTFSREAWELLYGHFKAAITRPEDITARSAVQWGAHLAGLAIENAMLGAAHALANPLTAHYSMIHGQAVGQLLPFVVEFNGVVAEELYADLLHASRTTVSGSAARTLAEILRGFGTIAELPKNLKSQGVSEGMLAVLADEAAQQWTGKFNPRPVGYAELHSLYQAAL